MNHPANKKYKYQVGGTLRINRSVFYVERRADNILFDSIKAGEFCYVLNSRQMGKSSLALNTIKRLRTADPSFACVIIDINILGSEQVSQEQWYRGFSDYLIEELELDEKINLSKWWQQEESLSPVQKLDKLLRKFILVEVEKPIAIFVDEIDKILDLKFKFDDFFGLIRSFYNEKAKNPIFENLSFVLLGVARPEELIKEYQITPFNIGKAIGLSGFSVDESLPLATGLTEAVDNPQQVIKEIISWTGGQPFLTQKVCQLILNHPKENKAESDRNFVKRLVEDHIINNWEANDDPIHLKTIKGRLLHNQQSTSRLLGLYQQILEDGAIAADDQVEQIELRLSGLVVRENDQLKPYNHIYQSVFNLDWVNTILDKERPYAEYIHAWKESKYDNKWLLREEKLEEALSWSKGKSLSDKDYQYLNSSKDLKIKETSAQIALEREKQEKSKVIYRSGIIISFLGILSLLLLATNISGYRPCIEENRIEKECFDFDISSGEEKIFRYSSDSYVSKGIDLFEQGHKENNKESKQRKKNFEYAELYFRKALKRRPNDPVPKIFANNAKARRLDHESLKLAVVVPLDSEEDYSRMILRGVADAQEKFNHNRQEKLLEIIIANDSSDEKLAKKVAKKLSKDKDILGVIGHNSSAASKEAKEVYEHENINMAMISPAATLTDLANDEKGVFFRTIPSDEAAGKRLAKYAQDFSSVVIFYDQNSEYSTNLKDAFKDDYQGEIIKEKNLQEFETTIVSDVNNIENDVDNIENFFDGEFKSVEAAVLLPSFGTRLLAIDVLKENSSQSSQPMIKNLLGNDLMYSSNFLKEAGSSAEGLVIAVTWSRNTCYGKKAEKRWERVINWRTAASYDAAQAFIQAIKETPNPNPKNIRDKLRSYTEENPITDASEDTIWFYPNGDSNKRSRLVKVVKNDKNPTPSGLDHGFEELEPDKDKDCSRPNIDN